MRQSFKISYSIPPGRAWFYQIPGGPFLESLRDLDDLVHQVRAKLVELGLPEIPELELEIQDYMCKTMPSGYCTGKPEIEQVTYHEVVDSTRSILSSARKVNKIGHVAENVIDARANACMACPLHSMQLCLTCKGILTEFQPYVGSRSTPYDRTLRVCRACMGAVPFLLQVDADAMPKKDYPAECWVRKELSRE